MSTLSHRLWPALALGLLISGCSSLSSSTPAPGVALPAKAAEGKVFITEAKLPEGTKHKVLGTVEAKHRAGYSGSGDLYPMMADEARKLGANAVVQVNEGRRVTALSWAATYVEGTAVQVDESALKDLKGSSH